MAQQADYQHLPQTGNITIDIAFLILTAIAFIVIIITLITVIYNVSSSLSLFAGL